MTKRIRSIALALAASLPFGAMFAVPAHAEDTGLVRHLNAQTRAQVQAAKSDEPQILGKLDRETTAKLKNANEQVRRAEKQMGAGIRG